jgi:FtsH-binding integral membrane protein
MFVRFLGNFLYWIGWGLAVLLIGIAIILAFTMNPLVPLVLCGIGLIVWVIAIELKYFICTEMLLGSRTSSIRLADCPCGRFTLLTRPKCKRVSQIQR